MRIALVSALCLASSACVWSSSETVAPPDAAHPATDAIDEGTARIPPPKELPERFRVADPDALVDFVPPTFLGVEPSTREERADGSVHAEFSPPGRTVTLDLARIEDVRATRASFELLGRNAEARMDGHELRGLRFQGNPAQVERDLSGDHTGRLSVVAANTYLVTFSVTPVEDLDQLLRFADGIDAGGALTRLALKEHKARRGDAGDATLDVRIAPGATAEPDSD